jgi:thiol-disulfide isomerase/thioredoxin
MTFHGLRLAWSTIDPMSRFPGPTRVRLRRATVLSALVAALVVAGCGREAVGGQAGFELPSLDGRKLGPADYEGKVVVVDFWATWCAPCHVQADILETLHREYPESEIAFLAVNVGEDEGTVRAFVADRPFPYPVLLDEKETVSTSLGVAALPSLMIVDREGGVSYFRPGIVRDRELRELLTQAGAPAAPAG